MFNFSSSFFAHWYNWKGEIKLNENASWKKNLIEISSKMSTLKLLKCKIKNTN